jgi:hypothetical protein
MVTALNSPLSRISPRTAHLTRRLKVSTPSLTPPLRFTTSLPIPTVFQISPECSPCSLTKTYLELILPAVRGTTSILNSALKHGDSLKRLILTSSVAAVREDTTVPRVFTESNWNNSSVDAVKTKGSEAGPVATYLASKTLAEKAAWEFVAAHRSEISWDLVAINPPLVFGASPFFASFSLAAEVSTHTYSLRSAPRRQSMTSIPLSVKSMTHCPVRGQVRNYGVRETGCMWLSPQRHTCAQHMR